MTEKERAIMMGKFEEDKDFIFYGWVEDDYTGEVKDDYYGWRGIGDQFDQDDEVIIANLY